MNFPSIQGENLHRKTVDMPALFAGRYTLVFIAFQQWHQSEVDTWLPFAQALEAERDDLWYYELPTIREMNRMSRIFLREGMRAGIGDPTARERTITLHLDKPRFRAALALPDEEHIYVLLLNPEGEELWRGRGRFAEPAGAAVRTALPAT